MALVVISTLVSTRIPAFYSAGRKKGSFVHPAALRVWAHSQRGFTCCRQAGEDEEEPPQPGGLCLPSRDPAPASPSGASAELQPISQLHHRKHLKQPQKGAWGCYPSPDGNRGTGHGHTELQTTHLKCAGSPPMSSSSERKLVKRKKGKHLQRNAPTPRGPSWQLQKQERGNEEPQKPEGN